MKENWKTRLLKYFEIWNCRCVPKLVEKKCLRALVCNTNSLNTY